MSVNRLAMIEDYWWLVEPQVSSRMHCVLEFVAWCLFLLVFSKWNFEVIPHKKNCSYPWRTFARARSFLAWSSEYPVFSFNHADQDCLILPSFLSFSSQVLVRFKKFPKLIWIKSVWASCCFRFRILYLIYPQCSSHSHCQKANKRSWMFL